MDDVLSRIWNDLIGRLSGPLTLRLVLQPAMASFYAMRDGLRDAKARRPPYLFTIFTHPDDRRWMIQEGVRAVLKIACLAIVLDVVYELIVFRRIYPVEAALVAVILALVPYFLLRGPINRLAVWWMER